jgi:murein DD-endopeptidase MepM/ murein hydrolase activator NlpD
VVTWYRPTLLPIDPAGTPDRGYATMRVTSPWGNRDNPLNPGTTSFHNGLDIGNARLGDTVAAVADGSVRRVGNLLLPWSQPTSQWPSGNYGGLMVILDHGTHISAYAHLGTALVGPGQTVKAGTPIGKVGESGSATGRGHLHFIISNHRAADIEGAGRLLPNAWTVDPWPLIEPAADAGDLPDTAGGQMNVVTDVVRFSAPRRWTTKPQIINGYDGRSATPTRTIDFTTTQSGASAMAVVEISGDALPGGKVIKYVEVVDGGFAGLYVPLHSITGMSTAPDVSGITQAELDAAVTAARADGIKAVQDAAATVK